MSEFHDPIDPSTLPKRKCAECGGVMKAVDAGTEGRSPVARYACDSCNHQAKLTPLENTGGWIALALLAWAIIAGLLFITGKPYDAESVIWTGIILIGFIAPFLPTYLKAKKYPFFDGEESGASSGFAGNLLFVALIFGVVLSGAAAISLLL
mgnify:CR=1 FL=1|jgi:hypothetical protein